MSARRTKFYLDKRNGKFLGVCSGIADYLGVDVTWVRVGMIVSLFTPINWITFVGYFAMAWTADKKPWALYQEDDDTQKFWQRTRVAPQRSIRDVRSSFRDIDRRLRDVETHVTSSNRGLAAEIDALK